MIEIIHRIVMEDRQIKVREIAKIVGFSVSAVHNILHEKLEMKKMCARLCRDGCPDCWPSTKNAREKTFQSSV